MNQKPNQPEPGTKLCIERSAPIDANAVTVMIGGNKGVYLCSECKKEYEERSE